MAETGVHFGCRRSCGTRRMAALAVLGICVAAMAAVDLAAHGTGHKPARSGSHPYSDSPRSGRFSMDDGLSSDDVFSLLQDREGFMWFGTKDGLNRFDGCSFRVYRFDPDDPTSISHNDVRAMLEDRDGSLWIATSGGLNRFDPDTERFTRFLHDPSNPSSISHDNISGAI